MEIKCSVETLAQKQEADYFMKLLRITIYPTVISLISCLFFSTVIFFPLFSYHLTEILICMTVRVYLVCPSYKLLYVGHYCLASPPPPPLSPPLPYLPIDNGFCTIKTKKCLMKSSILSINHAAHSYLHVNPQTSLRSSHLQTFLDLSLT